MAADSEHRALSLPEAAQNLLDECRMVLPGLQALFGFQLIAVFSERFATALSAGEQRLHLLAIMLSALAAAIIMTPAAFHRQTGPDEVTHHFLQLSGRLLLASMPPLALSVCADVYLIARVILGSPGAALCAALLLALYLLLWFLLPRARWLQQLLTLGAPTLSRTPSRRGR